MTAASVSEDTHYDADDLAWDAAKEVAITLMDGATRSGKTPAAGVKVRGSATPVTNYSADIWQGGSPGLDGAP